MAIYAGHASIDAYTMGRSIRQLEMAVSIGFQALATHGGFREFRKCECFSSTRSESSRLLRKADISQARLHGGDVLRIPLKGASLMRKRHEEHNPRHEVKIELPQRVCMRLYYYTAKRWGMKSLWERRLKIAEYADLNDPFELLPFRQTDKEARAHIKLVVRILSEGHGVLCFSESWQSTLMWAHYGDKHNGMCLGFEIEDGPHLTKIDYVPRRLPNRIDFSIPLGGVDEAMLAKCLNVKYSGWKYEKEYRLRVRLNDQRDGIFYYPFNSSVELREVIIGARSTLSIVDVAEAVGTQPEADVKIWTARAAHGAFNMCMNKEQPMDVISGVDAATKKQRKLAELLRE